MSATEPTPDLRSRREEAALVAHQGARAPVVLLMIAFLLIAGGSAMPRDPSGKPGFWLVGAGGAFAICAALLGRLETRRWLAVGLQSGLLGLLGVTTFIDRRLESIALGFFLGALLARVLARRLDPEWARLVDDVRRRAQEAAKAAQKAKLAEGRRASAEPSRKVTGAT